MRRQFDKHFWLQGRLDVDNELFNGYFPIGLRNHRQKLLLWANGSNGPREKWTAYSVNTG